MPHKDTSEGRERKRFAFIDVYNTINTTEKLLGFTIDWVRLHAYLKERWECEKLFFYAGIEIGDSTTQLEYEQLRTLGYEMRTKTTIPYKRKDRIEKLTCPDCKKEFTKTIGMGYEKKSNCDVELTVDAIAHSDSKSDALIFTGDGDFEYLIKYLISSGVRVYVISNASETSTQKKRFSTKLREMVKKGEVTFINIGDWQKKIEKLVV